jgi:hypothetical protein
VVLASQTAEYLMDGPLTEARILQAGEIAARECRPIDDLCLVRNLLVRGL